MRTRLTSDLEIELVVLENVGIDARLLGRGCFAVGTLAAKKKFSDFLDRKGGTYRNDSEGRGMIGLLAGGGLLLGLEGDGISEMKLFAQVLAGTKVGLAGVRRSKTSSLL